LLEIIGQFEPQSRDTSNFGSIIALDNENTSTVPPSDDRPGSEYIELRIHAAEPDNLQQGPPFDQIIGTSIEETLRNVYQRQLGMKMPFQIPDF